MLAHYLLLMLLLLLLCNMSTWGLQVKLCKPELQLVSQLSLSHETENKTRVSVTLSFSSLLTVTQTFCLTPARVVKVVFNLNNLLQSLTFTHTPMSRVTQASRFSSRCAWLSGWRSNTTRGNLAGKAATWTRTHTHSARGCVHTSLLTFSRE